MSVLELRPRFRWILTEKPEVVLAQFRQMLNENRHACTGSLIDRHGTLVIPEEDRHFWSPQLNIEVEEHPEGTLLRGLFGPHPAVWTLFVFFYALVAFAGTMGMVYGLTQLSLNQQPWALWSIPLALGIALGIYLIGRAGRKLGMSQTRFLYRVLEKHLRPKGFEVIREG